MLIFALGIVVAGLVVAFIPSREASYAGKRLSEWVDGYATRSSSGESDEAIRHIGTNAIPYLLKWIQYETPGWKSVLSERLHRIPVGRRLAWEPHEREFRASWAVLAFRALGSEAKQAFPELCRLMNNPDRGGPAARATAALGFLGKDALQPLMRALTNKDARIRVSAVSAVSFLNTNARPAVPLLIQSLNDPDLFVAVRATMVLGELKLEPDLAISALTNSLQDPRGSVRVYAARALGRFGNEARQALPALANHLADSDRSMRNAVTNAIREIDPGALARAAR